MCREEERRICGRGKRVPGRGQRTLEKSPPREHPITGYRQHERGKQVPWKGTMDRREIPLVRIARAGKGKNTIPLVKKRYHDKKRPKPGLFLKMQEA